jgi:hypothetical protein
MPKFLRNADRGARTLAQVNARENGEPREEVHLENKVVRSGDGQAVRGIESGGWLAHWQWIIGTSLAIIGLFLTLGQEVVKMRSTGK